MKLRRQSAATLGCLAVLSVGCGNDSPVNIETPPTSIQSHVAKLGSDQPNCDGTSSNNLDKVLDCVDLISKKAGVITGAISVVKGYIEMAETLGRMLELLPAQQNEVLVELAKLQDHIDNVSVTVEWHENTRVRDEVITGLLGAIRTTSDAVREGHPLSPSLIYDTDQLVLKLSTPSAFERLYVPSDTDGEPRSNSHGGYQWKLAVPFTEGDLLLRDGYVFDWRLALPAFMTAVALQLEVLALQNPNVFQDGSYATQIEGYYLRLKQLLTTMDNGIRCGHVVLPPVWVECPFDDMQLGCHYNVVTSCADIYTGINITDNREYGSLDPILAEEFPYELDDLGVEVDLGRFTSSECCPLRLDSCFPECVAIRHQAYQRWFDSTIRVELDRKRFAMMQKTPRFALQAMVDALYALLTDWHDLTETASGQVLTNATSTMFPGAWCIEEVNAAILTSRTDDPFRLALAAPCIEGSSASQRWNYDREAQTITNPASGLCLEAPDCDASTLSQSGGCPQNPAYDPAGFHAIVAPCNNRPEQRWTYSIEDRHLYNGRGFALELRPNDVSLQTLAGDWRASTRNQTYLNYRSSQVFSVDPVDDDVFKRVNRPVEIVEQEPGSQFQYGFSAALGNVYTGPFTLPEGVSTVYYRIVSPGGVAGPTQSQTFRIDPRAPVATATLAAADIVEFSAVDPSPGAGVSGVYATVYVGDTQGPTQFVPGAQGSLSIAPDFTRIEYWAKDVAGNQQSTQTIYNYPKMVLDDGPRMYYRLGEASGTDAQDLAPPVTLGRYRGTHGDTFPPRLGDPGAIAGDPNTAAWFRAYNDYKYSPPGVQPFVEIARNDDEQVPTQASLTLEAWFTMEPNVPQQSYAALVHKTTVAGLSADGYGIVQWNSTLWFYHSHWGSRVGVPFAKINSPASYHHIVGTYDGRTNSIYLDGELIDSKPASGPVNAGIASLKIGAGWYQFGWQGRIDEVATYPTALSAQQVRTHFRAGKGLAPLLP